MVVKLLIASERDITKLLSWRDNHKDLVRACPIPYTDGEIVLVHPAITLSFHRDGVMADLDYQDRVQKLSVRIKINLPLGKVIDTELHGTAQHPYHSSRMIQDTITTYASLMAYVHAYPGSIVRTLEGYRVSFDDIPASRTWQPDVAPEKPVDFLASLEANEPGELYLHVDVTTGRRPLPMLFLSWEKIGLGALMFSMIKQFAKPAYTKVSRWHKWPVPVWSTEKLLVGFGYRNDDVETSLRCALAIQGVPNMVDTSLKKPESVWYNWRGAFEESNYFLLVHGTPERNAFYHPQEDDTPIFRLKNFGMVELADREVTEHGIKMARGELVHQSATWQMIEQALSRMLRDE